MRRGKKNTSVQKKFQGSHPLGSHFSFFPPPFWVFGPLPTPPHQFLKIAAPRRPDFLNFIIPLQPSSNARGNRIHRPKLTTNPPDLNHSFL